MARSVIQRGRVWSCQDDGALAFRTVKSGINDAPRTGRTTSVANVSTLNAQTGLGLT